MARESMWYRGFLGFLGFFSLRYFSTGDVKWLAWFAYFAFFVNFLIARLGVTIPHERYRENVRLAQAFVGQLALFEVFILLFLSIFVPYRELHIFGLAIVWVSLVLAYAIKLYQLEGVCSLEQSEK